MVTVYHHSATLVIPIGDPRDGFFYPTLTLMMDTNRWSSGRIFLSHPHTHDGYLYYWPFQAGTFFVDHLCYLCLVFVVLSVCSLLPCGHLKGNGWPLGSCLWCLLWFCYWTNWYSGTGVVLACIDSWSLLSFLLCFPRVSTNWSNWVALDCFCLNPCCRSYKCYCRRAEIFNLSQSGIDPRSMDQSKTLYHVAVKASFYSDVVEFFACRSSKPRTLDQQTNTLPRRCKSQLLHRRSRVFACRSSDIGSIPG